MKKKKNGLLGDAERFGAARLMRKRRWGLQREENKCFFFFAPRWVKGGNVSGTVRVFGWQASENAVLLFNRAWRRGPRPASLSINRKFTENVTLADKFYRENARIGKKKQPGWNGRSRNLTVPGVVFFFVFFRQRAHGSAISLRVQSLRLIC